MKSLLGYVADPYTTLAASAAAAIAARRDVAVAVPLALAAPVALGLSKLIKGRVDEHRPRLLSKSPEQSFPSGHSAGVAGLALAAALQSTRAWAVPAALAAIVAVNVSRVRARDHWPRDVLVGDGVGIAAAVGALALGRWLERRRR